MKQIAYLVVALTSILAAGATAVAQTTAASTAAETQSIAATLLFGAVCIENGANEAKVKTWVRDHHLRPLDPVYQSKVLHGKPGEVWSASDRTGDYLVVIETPGQCSVWARRANATTSMQHFQKIIHGVERPGLTVKLETDRILTSASATYHMVVYTIRKNGADVGMLGEAVTSDSPNAEVQVRFKLAHVKTTQVQP